MRCIYTREANQTRFLLLYTQRLDPLPLTKPLDFYLFALIRVRVGAPPSSKSNLDLSGIFQSLVAASTSATTLCSLSIRHVDRRPSLNAIPFHDTVFVELAGGHDGPVMALHQWHSTVIAGVERVRHYLRNSGHIEGEVADIGTW
jgi:hypothetical protein